MAIAMFRKQFILVLLVLLGIGMSDAATWKLHCLYVANQTKNLYDTGKKVYYLNSGQLYQFDKESQTTYLLSSQNALSDYTISNIYYDWEYDLLFVAYSNSDIDVINGDGKVTNISNIKDVVIPSRSYTVTYDDNGNLESYVGTSIKAINDITFKDGIAYVAAGYGYVTIDEKTLRVIRNYDFNNGTINVNSVGMVGDKLVVLTNNYIYYGSPASTDPIGEFARKGNDMTGGASMYQVDDHSFLLIKPSSGLYHVDMSSGEPAATRLVSATTQIHVQRSASGYIANFEGQDYYYTLDAAGKNPVQVPATLSFATSNPKGDGTLWICDSKGLHVNGQTAYYKLNSLSMDAPYWLSYNAASDKLYASLSAPNKVNNMSNITQANVINTYDGHNWTDATAYSAAGGGYEFVFNPVNPRMYVRSSWNTGIYNVINDALKVKYTSSNAPFAKYKPIPAFDKYGNLWVVNTYKRANYSAPAVTVLPAAKLTSGSVSKSDWFSPTTVDFTSDAFQHSRFLVSRKNNVKIFSDCDFNKDAYKGHILCWDNGSEDFRNDNYRFVSLAQFYDQDNKLISWTYLSNFEEDKDGLIWIGHTKGLFVLDPDVVFDPNPKVTRPFVSSVNEDNGYLCEGTWVYDIAVDRDNNKWIASSNGVYFVSPDGTSIYSHYTISNSDIPSNEVYSVECDTVNNRVYIYTDNGFAELIEGSDAAALNNDNVWVYPNMVDPDYTGLIKIGNMMDNSFVTITDNRGTVVKQIGPVMGGALWDGCGEDGERVATGVYRFYVQQGSYPTTTGEPKASIMIIK